jgi:hypothetical protein
MQIPLFGLGQKGKSATATAQRHLGLYAEIVADQDKSRIVFYGTPGLTLDYSFGDTPVRGSIAAGDFKYEVHRGTFWEVNNAGIKTNRGSIATTSGRVQMSYNGTQIVLVDDVNAYCYTIATTAFATVASGLFANPIDVTYQDQYFIYAFENGRFQISAPNDGTTVDALDFATAESNPDGLVRGIADHGEIVLLGNQTTEFWGNSGGQDFPYTNQRGSALEFGLAAAYSLVKYNDSLAGLFKSTMGQVQVMMMRGHALTPISTPEIDSIINGYATVSDATAFSYMEGGHPMYQINFPTAGTSWLFDSQSGLWSPLESGLSGGRSRAEIRTDYLNKVRVTDYENGNVYTLDPDVYTDNGTPIPREIITRHFFQDGKRIAVKSLQIDFEMGQGLITGQGSDPQAMLQFSKDGGHTWSNEIWVSLGAIGAYTARAKWTRVCEGRDLVFKIRISDPIEVVITNAYMDMEVRD